LRIAIDGIETLGPLDQLAQLTAEGEDVDLDERQSQVWPV
jgi:hypothetical protein